MKLCLPFLLHLLGEIQELVVQILIISTFRIVLVRHIKEFSKLINLFIMIDGGNIVTEFFITSLAINLHITSELFKFLMLVHKLRELQVRSLAREELLQGLLEAKNLIHLIVLEIDFGCVVTTEVVLQKVLLRV